jgi:hypothetical protein
MEADLPVASQLSQRPAMTQSLACVHCTAPRPTTNRFKHPASAWQGHYRHLSTLFRSMEIINSAASRENNQTGDLNRPLNQTARHNRSSMSEEIDKHVLKRYDVGQKLGKGAYGIVWKAVDKKSQKLVALKKVYDAFQV